MAEGFSRMIGWEAYSAGSKPESAVNSFAVKVMAERDIDISHHIPKSVNDYLNHDFDLVATVCSNARETCSVYRGNCMHQIHHGFEDPADATGSDEEITAVYRRIRDEIQVWVEELSRNFLDI